MDAASDDPAVLLARSAKLRLFVMLRRTLDPASLRDHLGAHLRWMIDAEQAGMIFLSGPVAPHEGATKLDGLTVIRAADLAGAEQLAQSDPFVKAGIVGFELCEWTVNEGAIPIMVTLSDSTATIR